MKKPPPRKKPVRRKKPSKVPPLHHGAPPAGILHRGAPPVKPAHRKPRKVLPKKAGVNPGGLMIKPRALSGGVPCVAAAVAAYLGVPEELMAEFCPDEAFIEDVLEEVMPYAFPERRRRQLPGLHETRAGLILGVDLPGPHAVLAVGGWWLTWGEWHPAADFPDAVVEEAWVLW